MLAQLALARRPVTATNSLERLAHLADGAAAAIADDGADDRRAVAAVAVIDVLDHLLAPLVLEIDVDIGRLVAPGRPTGRATGD
jgi:hypothetical protein